VAVAVDAPTNRAFVLNSVGTVVARDRWGRIRWPQALRRWLPWLPHSDAVSWTRVPETKEVDEVEVLIERSEQTGQERRVIVPSRVIAALSQLESAEQAAVREAFQALGREGVQPLPGIDVRKLDTPEPLYVLYLDAAPDVLILVRTRADTSVEIVDLVRPATIQSLFHTR
jgi:hypothetical protein